MSLRKLGMAATPGRLRMALLMSRPPPGLRLISLVPMRRRETGASSSPFAVTATTSAASTATVKGSSVTLRKAGRAGVNLQAVGRFVADRTETEVDHTWRQAGQFEAPLEIGRGARRGPLDHHGNEGQRFTGDLVGDHPFDRSRLAPGLGGENQE